MSKKCSSYCPAPWVNIHIHPTGFVKPCCIYNDEGYDSVNELSLKTTYLNQKAKKLREDFVNGNPPKACLKCFAKEEVGIQSMRLNYIERYGSDFSGEPGDTSLVKELDLSFSNKCNLVCRFCGPYCSSSWIDQAKNINNDNESFYPLFENYPWQKFNIEGEVIANQLEDFPNLETIEIKGGEPFLSNDHYDFLKILVNKSRAKDISLRYVTNGTICLEKYRDVLKEFRSVHIIFSMEGVGPIYDYLRGIKNGVAIIENALDFYSESKNTTLGIHFLLSGFNIFAIQDFYEWFLSNKPKYNLSLSLGTVVDPSSLNLLNLPFELRMSAVEQIQDDGSEFIRNVIGNLLKESVEDLSSSFVRYTRDMEKFLGGDILKVEPQFKNIFESND